MELNRIEAELRIWRLPGFTATDLPTIQQCDFYDFYDFHEFYEFYEFYEFCEYCVCV